MKFAGLRFNASNYRGAYQEWGTAEWITLNQSTVVTALFMNLLFMTCLLIEFNANSFANNSFAFAISCAVFSPILVCSLHFVWHVCKGLNSSSYPSKFISCWFTLIMLPVICLIRLLSRKP